MTLHGSCLCGDVAFTLEGALDRFFFCHCSRCRKGTGSAHASNLFSSTGTLSWTSGAERVRTWRMPGSRHARSFCETCGAPVPTTFEGSPLVKIPAGCLDDEVDVTPTARIYLGSAASWEARMAEAPGFDTYPGRD